MQLDMSWVIFHPCGCVAQLVSADPSYMATAVKSVNQALKVGRTVELKTNEWIRAGQWTALSKCPHRGDSHAA